MKKAVSFIMAVVLLNLSFFGAAKSQTKDYKNTEKVKKQVIKIAAKKSSKRVKIVLKDGAKIYGYINKIEAEKFIISEDETGKLVPIEFTNVKNLRMKEKGEGKSVAITLGVLGFFALVLGVFATSDGF